MKTQTAHSRPSCLIAAALVLFGPFSGCAPREAIRQSSRAADQTIFSGEKSASHHWNPSRGRLANPEVQNYVQSVLEKVARHSKSPGDFKLRVTDETIVNGASLANGTIIVTRGMLYACVNEGELAGYLGHEIAHRDLGHAGYKKKKSLVGDLVKKGMGLIPDTYGAVDVLEKHGEEMAQRRFNRKDEQSADEGGAELAGKAGYNPYALADLFDRLSGLVTKDALYRIGKLKGTHKALDVRAQHLRDYLKQKGASPSGTLAADEYRSSLASLGSKTQRAELSPEQKELCDIERLVQAQKNLGKPFELAQFLGLMRRLSKLAQAEYSQAPHFMEEMIYRDSPIGEENAEASSLDRTALLDAIAHVGVGAIPVVGDVVDFYELVEGLDFLTGDSLSSGDRMLAGLGLLIGSGAAYRQIAKTLKEAKAVGDVGSALVALERAREALPSVRASPTLRRLAEEGPFSRTHFYVRPNGDVIPATGYRYLNSASPNIESMLKSGSLPPGAQGNYISFDKFSSAQQAKSGLQVPHDARYRAEIDMKQALGDLRIPKGDWGRADYLEPITKDFPEFGVGGAYQAVTDASLQATRITDLLTGKTIYGH